MTKIPSYVKEIVAKLEANGFEAFVVGGCVRDAILEREPNDWDVTTNARPEEVQKVFPDGRYENIFGTVLLPIRNKEPTLEAFKEPALFFIVIFNRCLDRNNCPSPH